MSSPMYAGPYTTTTGSNVAVFRGASNITIEGGSISTHTVSYEFNGNVRVPVEGIPVPQGEITTFENTHNVHLKNVKMKAGQLDVVHNSTVVTLAGGMPVPPVIRTRAPMHNLVPQSTTNPQSTAVPPGTRYGGSTWTRAQQTRVRSRMDRVATRYDPYTDAQLVYPE